MAGSSLLLLLDDIASVLDDVAAMTKVAARKTAGVLGDDLALNAEQVAGVRAERELPVVWAVAKGSLVNKLILVPAALAISWAAPWAIMPLLMVGGAYLCYEGFEKILHAITQRNAAAGHGDAAALPDPPPDLAEYERTKIRGAIRTDFVLSAEIVVITLGTVAEAAFATRLAVLAGVALLMTVGVYGLVAAIVKLDDAGLHLCKRPGSGLFDRLLQGVGRVLLGTAPRLMKALSVIGTAAMFLVGGGIVVHGLPALHHLAEQALQRLAGTLLEAPAGLALPLIVGFVVGGLAYSLAVLLGKFRRGGDAHP